MPSAKPDSRKHKAQTEAQKDPLESLLAPSGSSQNADDHIETQHTDQEVRPHDSKHHQAENSDHEGSDDLFDITDDDYDHKSTEAGDEEEDEEVTRLTGPSAHGKDKDVAGEDSMDDMMEDLTDTHDGATGIHDEDLDGLSTDGTEENDASESDDRKLPGEVTESLIKPLDHQHEVNGKTTDSDDEDTLVDEVVPKPKAETKKQMKDFTLEDLVADMSNGKKMPKRMKRLQKKDTNRDTAEDALTKEIEEMDLEKKPKDDLESLDLESLEDKEKNTDDSVSSADNGDDEESLPMHIDANEEVNAADEFDNKADEDFLSGIQPEFNRINEESRMTKRKAIKRTNRTQFKPQIELEDDGTINAGLAAAIRYLGSGYDIVFGNPLGDPVIMVDPGYRDPVLKLDWTEDYHNHDGANLKEPRGGWIRPELSCRQAETVDHVNTIEDYKKELSVDAKISADIPFYFGFSASGGYKTFVKTLSTNTTKNYILKTYCLRYVAGIQDFKSVQPMPSFKNDVEELPEKFDSESCTMEIYRNDEDDKKCVDSVHPWIKFFKKYGTHYTTVIHLGGKVTNQIQMKKTDVAAIQKHGYNIDSYIKANSGIPFLNLGQASFNSAGDMSSDSKKNSFKTERSIIVIGGDVPTDGTDKVSMQEWTRSLYRKPMPIKVNLDSIKTLIEDKEKRATFDVALKYYSELYGISPDEIYAANGVKNGIATMAMGGQVVTYEGYTAGSAVCPDNNVIMMGFALTVTRKRKLVFNDSYFVTSIAPCPVGKEKCIASGSDPNSEVRVWILCGKEPIPLLIQETAVSSNATAVASCPADYTIAFGFGISIPKGLRITNADSYACRSGQSSCTHTSSNKSYNAVWIACVEKNAPELSNITSHAVVSATSACPTQSHTSYVDNKCPQNSKLITSWKINVTKKEDRQEQLLDNCSKEWNGCKVDNHFKRSEDTCKAQYSWIACYTPPQFLKDRE
ncbi:MAC/perforin domain containing protein, putative [Babesia bigemina]|uniref:MAC/perforin domain containing protein, putative n=1 Tax=Babesia bigemina TaxID=5866 RepID=A0A061DER9_BABBI|nr:MAC/perforin domain containing protein, putative [Babesia bigemina]CDR97760.1 MAC/perforin domain containing protein, putative [Babesia bigemina]|eukprot:XP_012769946.1 MAC/perforin domain containing protein, putative [Babesia bigemina]